MIKKIIKNLLPHGLIRMQNEDANKETHINRALRAIDGHTYLEIGVSSGSCFRQIIAPRKIGVDPQPMDFRYKLRDGESFFQITSDDFFANHAEELFCDHMVDVALVDGLHEFSQTLTDILALEKYMSPNGVIFIHDCNPPYQKHTTGEDIDWTGDVWKVPYFLTTYRPDLHFFTLDCDWGLGVLSGFGSSPHHEAPSTETCKKCKELDYAVLQENRRKVLQLRPPWYSRLFFRRLRRGAL